MPMPDPQSKSWTTTYLFRILSQHISRSRHPGMVHLIHIQPLITLRSKTHMAATLVIVQAVLKTTSHHCAATARKENYSTTDLGATMCRAVRSNWTMEALLEQER